MKRILLAAPLLPGGGPYLLLPLLAGDLDLGLGVYLFTAQGLSAKLLGLGFVCAGLGVVSLGLGETIPVGPNSFTVGCRLFCATMGALFCGLLWAGL